MLAKAVTAIVWLWSQLLSVKAETYTTLWLGSQFTWHTEEPPIYNVTTYTGQVFEARYPPWCQDAVGGGMGQQLSRFCDLCNSFQDEYWAEWQAGHFHSYYFITPAYLLWLVAFILWVAYMFEHNIIHKTAVNEFVTRWIILVFALLPTFLFFKFQFHKPSDMLGYFRCHEAIQVICVGFLMLLASSRSLRLHPDFHGGRAMLAGTPRHLIRARNKKPKPKALQHVERIRAETSTLVDLEWVNDSARFFISLLLAISILGDVALIDTRLSETVNILMVIFLMAIIVGLIIWGIYAYRNYLRAVRRIQGMFELILETCREEHLRYVLANINMQKLIKFSPELRRHLCVEPITRSMYDTWCKAVSIDAIQKLEIGVSLNTDLQKLLYDIVKSCHGEELTYLKTLTDGSGSYLNFYKLIYTDMRHREMREELLRHIKAEAFNVRSAFGVQGIKVLSDIDDTCKASGGRPAGLDKQYPRGTMYPGVFAMYRYLDAGWDPTKPSCNLVFLSARPHVFKGMQEENVYAPMVPLYEDGFIHSFPTLLPGGFHASVTAGVAQYWCGTRAWRQVGLAKFHTYQQYRDLYQEYDFVFCGDDGQGDLLAGQMMIEEESEEGGPKLLAVLIHEILPDSGRPAQVISEEDDIEQDDAWRQSWLSRGLILHKTYVGAAVKLHGLYPNTFKLEVVHAIATKAVEEFIGIVATTIGRTEAQWKEAMEYLQHDLSEADKLCRQAGLAKIPQIPALKELINMEDEELEDAEESEDSDGAPLLAE